MRLPVQDSGVIRQLAFAQLEKRGLASGTIDQTPFACHLHSDPDGKPVLIADVLTGGAEASLEAVQAAGYLPSARACALPADRIVIVREHDRPVLFVSDRGSLVHTQVIAAAPDDMERIAADVRLAILSLRQQGLIREVAGVELRGSFPAGAAAGLEARLALPVAVVPRPGPDPAAVARSRPEQLLPASVRTSRRIRRLKPLRWVAAAAVPVLIGLWALMQYRKLAALEGEARRMEEALQVSAGPAGEAARIRERVRNAQELWNGLRMALDPKRYPLIQLNSLTRCLGDTGAVFWRFESKGSELSVAGTARSAGDAYRYFTAVSGDRDLSIFAWSMAQPTISEDGRARFEIKGRLK